MIYTPEHMEPLFEMLERCKGRQQMPEHHPEGDVFVHSVQVMDHAFKESYDTDLILAAMLHDIGKYEETHGHEQKAVEWLTPYCSVKTLWLIENHMRFWYFIDGRMRRLGKCLDLAGHPWLPQLCMLARWDKMGRNPNKQVVYNPATIIDRLNKRAAMRFQEVKKDVGQN